MGKKIAFIFPGQGAQYPGMGRDFYHQFPEVKEMVDRADEILGYSLSEMIFEGSSEDLKQTRYSQPAIFITSLAILKVIQDKFPVLVPSYTLGLSLGEYTAMVAAGILPFEEGLKLVQARADAMQKASEATPGTMAAVLGLDPDLVEEVLEKMRPDNAIWIANLNCPSQVVIAGTKEAVEAANEPLIEKGAKRVVPLNVSGAFHTPLMQPAAEELGQKVESVTLHQSETRLLMNAAGDFVEDLDEMRKLLLEQVMQPVLWEKSIHAVMEQGIDLFLEVGPGKTLCGMLRKINRELNTLNVENIEDLDRLEEYLICTVEKQ
ncbi:MAG: ACP S-malonyltransferase [Candidatus Algichlamydia australiensis]|nr:ACP S-malonyltransferase [Chlamydiales bacterium]